jgi:benzoate transport porin
MNKEIKMRRHHLSIAMIAATMTVGATTSHADFVKDSNVQLKFKNFYLDRQYDTTKNKNWGSWTQGITLDAKSGYHEIGSVKVGIDLLAQHAFLLHGRDQNPDWVVPHDGTGQKDNFGKVGATLKLKVSETELRVGEILPFTPIVTFDPSRQLLTTYQGVWLESKDIDKTKITLGYLDGINARYENQVHDFNLWPLPLDTELSQKNKGMYVAGVDYQVTPELGMSYFYGDITNIYRQNYVGFSYNKKLDEHNKIATHARYFDNRESGDAIYGDIDSQALSLRAAWTHDNHTIDAGWQQMFGEHGNNAAFFPSLSGWVPQPFLVNWSVASFIRKDEKSWSLGYTYDFKDIGVPGLTTTLRHYDGWNIDNGAGKKRGKEDENNVIVNYVVPEGKLKGLGVQYMYIDVNYHDVPNFPSDLEEHRAAVTYSYKF